MGAHLVLGNLIHIKHNKLVVNSLRKVTSVSVYYDIKQRRIFSLVFLLTSKFKPIYHSLGRNSFLFHAYCPYLW